MLVPETESLTVYIVKYLSYYVNISYNMLQPVLNELNKILFQGKKICKYRKFCLHK